MEDLQKSLKTDIEYVTMALAGRIMSGDLETDFESLTSAISLQTEVDIEVCKEIIKQDTIPVITECLKTIEGDND